MKKPLTLQRAPMHSSPSSSCPSLVPVFSIMNVTGGWGDGWGLISANHYCTRLLGAGESCHCLHHRQEKAVLLLSSMSSSALRKVVCDGQEWSNRLRVLHLALQPRFYEVVAT
jgi:hypothetical protein